MSVCTCSETECEFILKSPTSLYHHIGYSHAFLWFSVNAGSSSESYDPPPDLHLLNCSVPVYVYSSVRIFSLHLHVELCYQRTVLYTVYLPFVV